MRPTVDEQSDDLRIDASVRCLVLPVLSADALGRIMARRETGERIALPVTAAHGMRSRSFELWISGALVTAAAVVIALIGAQQLALTRNVVTSDLKSLAPATSVCGGEPDGTGAITIGERVVSAFGVAVACGAESIPSPPIVVDGSRVLAATLVYGSRTVTDRAFTSEHPESTTYSISHRIWNGVPALLAVRTGPLIMRVSVDSLTVATRDLTPLHWASWYPTQNPVGSLHADFDSSSISIEMAGRIDTSGRFPYVRVPGRLPWGWAEALVIPALQLSMGWMGTIQIAAPYHPHAHDLFSGTYATMPLRVIGRETIRVPAGSFDCWKLESGPPDYRSFLWVSTAKHFVVQSETIYRTNDTEFDDTHYLQSVRFAPM